MMRRRAFLINSTVLILLIPLMLLLATYESVSYQIIEAQSYRMQTERTSRIIGYLEVDFQKALEISAQRAIISTTEYVAVHGFIQNEPANETISRLIVWGISSQGITNEQNLKNWLGNISTELKNQGYTVYPSPADILSHINITVAPLDSFRVAVIARIPEIEIISASGEVSYNGPFPSHGNAIAVVSIEGLEDTFISRETYDLYHRLIKACEYPYPELTRGSTVVLNGTGSSQEHVIPGIYNDRLLYNETHILDTVTHSTITNTHIGTTPVPPTQVIDDGEIGVLIFEDTSPKEAKWNVFSKDEWENSTLQGEDYEITDNGLTLVKTWKVLWRDSSEYSVDGDEYRIVAQIPLVSQAVEYRWSTSIKVESKWWGPEATVRLRGPSEYVGPVSTTSNDWENNIVLFSSNPSNFYLELRGDTFNYLFGSSNAMGYTKDNIIEGLVYSTSGNWKSVLWNPHLKRPASIKELNVSVNLESYELASMKVGVDTNFDGIIDYWSQPISLSSGLNQLTQEDLGIPDGYGWQVVFELRVTSPNDLSHTPTIQGFSLFVKESESPTEFNSRAYVLKNSFIECLTNGRYFGLYNAPSFFERLEGRFDPSRHKAYEELSFKVQRTLDVSYNGKPYPIGLASFIMPNLNDRIKLVLSTAGLDPNNPNPEDQTCFDYYFLKYYLEQDDTTKKPGYKVYGIDTFIDQDFYLDYQTALALFGNDTTAVSDLLATG